MFFRASESQTPEARPSCRGARRGALARPQTARTTAQPLVQPRASTVDSLPHAPAPVGTRIHVTDKDKDAGYLQVTGISGTTVAVVNSSNQTSRLRAGLFSIRSGSKVDEKAFASIWPLQVGKRVEFEETNGDDRWQYTIDVVRRETITTPAGVFATWVIELRERALTPAQAGFARTRTYWYAPEVGMAVRLRSAQNGGPPVRLYNWDAARIVRP